MLVLSDPTQNQIRTDSRSRQKKRPNVTIFPHKEKITVGILLHRPTWSPSATAGRPQQSSCPRPLPAAGQNMLPCPAEDKEPCLNIQKRTVGHTLRDVNGQVNRFEEKMSEPSGRTKRSLFSNLFKLVVLLHVLEEKFSAPKQAIFESWFSERKEIASIFSNMDSDQPSSR